jgi:hypothetical protein
MSFSPVAGIIPPSRLPNSNWSGKTGLNGDQDFDALSATYTTDFTIQANGGVFATATTDDGTGEPVWVKPHGQPLTNAEENLIAAVGVAVIGATLNVFALVYFALLMVAA